MTTPQPVVVNPYAKWSDDDLFNALDRDLKLEDYARDPLRLARAVFPHHFRLPSAASWHREAIGLMTRTATVDTMQGQGVQHSQHIYTSRQDVTSSSPHISTESSGNSVSKTLTQMPALRVALHAPRGHAKSTLASFLVPMWNLMLGQKHFILLISNTHSQAVKFLQGMKYEWETNATLKSLVPWIKPSKEKWADSDIELLRGGKLAHKVVALGSGHQLRGLRFLQWRPDLIVIDDGEDDEMVRSDLRRLAYQEWLDNVVLKVDPQCDILKIGTIIHELGMLNRIIRQKEEGDRHRYADWTRRIFQAMDASQQSTWPERESTEMLLAERERNPYSFSQEKQGEPVDPSYCPFKSEFFTERRFWAQLPKHLAISITIDPAWTVRDHSKETALVCAGWDAAGRLWVLDEHHAKYDDPSLILDLILDWYVRWTKNEQANPGQQFFCVGFDTVSAQKMLMTSFRDRCRERNLHPNLRELKADRDKIRRIWQLEPLFRHDRIFLRPDMTYLQHQLQGFPRNVQGGLVDVADALAYFMQLEPYRPTQGEEEEAGLPQRPFAISFDDYAQLHEDHRRFRQQFPEVEDPSLIRTLVQGWATGN